MSKRSGTVAVSVLLIVSALIGIKTLGATNLSDAEAQAVKIPTTTVTVYVPTHQTVYLRTVQTVLATVFQTVRMPVTKYATVTSVITTSSLSTKSFSTTYSVTQWSTSLTTAMGILGTLPDSIFGRYSDVALAGVGVLGGAAIALASSRSVRKGVRALAVGEGMTESGAVDIDSLAELVMMDMWKVEDEELKDALEQMHDMNEVKKKMRDFLTKQKELRNKYKDILLRKTKDVDLGKYGE